MMRRASGARRDALAPRGVAAIDAHVDAADGGPEAGRFHPRPSNRFSGPGPVEHVTLHRVEGPPHWHVVTYGLSELHVKESPDRELSGWGFELTFRLADDEPEQPAPGQAAPGQPAPGQPAPGQAAPAQPAPGQAAPAQAGGRHQRKGRTDPRPLWAVDFLASLAAYVWSSRHPFAAGDIVDLRGPVRLGSDSPITAATIVEDPVLATLDGPFGRVQFLQVVGLTDDELELCRAWDTGAVTEILARDDPLLVTPLARGSILADPRWGEEIRRRSGEEGTSMEELRVGSLELSRRRFPTRTVAQMGAGAATALGPALRRHLHAKGDSFTVVGDAHDLCFLVDGEPQWEWGPDGLRVYVPVDRVEALAALFDGRTGWGRLPEWAGLQWRVVK